MSPAETAKLLAFVASIDNRRFDESTVVAWHAIVDYVPFEDGLAAVRWHFSKSDDYLKPFHICRFADDADRERRKHAREAREREAEERRMLEHQPTGDRSPEVTALVRQVADNLPGLPSDHAHAKAVLRANRERGRPVPPKFRKPKKRAPGDWPPPQTDDIAALATRYLIDGHDPAAVSERFAISRGWCRRTAKTFRTTNPEGNDRA